MRSRIVVTYNCSMKSIAIIGGGAAGLACAIAASRGAQQLGSALSVVVFERDDRVGRSILATGNGRCNFSNAHIDANVYRNPGFVADAFAALSKETASDNAVLELFASCGLEWREESEGRLYPLANKASAVLDVLRAEAARLGVREVCDRQVQFVDPPRQAGGHFTLRMSDGVFERADAVVVACGGKAAQRLQIADWHIPYMTPVLGPLKTNNELVRELNNIRARASVTLQRRDATGAWRLLARERGEVMFRKYGVSGIAVFNLSRFAQEGDRLLINFLPAHRDKGARATEPAYQEDAAFFADGAGSQDEIAEAALAFCHERAQRLARVRGFESNESEITCDDFLRGLVLPHVAHVLLKYVGMAGTEACTYERLALLANALLAFPLTVQGIADADNCQVHRGGYSVEALDAQTMESRDIARLYLVGEVVDIDAPCGGYNLHWAWSSGMLAGISCARSLCESAEQPTKRKVEARHD